MKQQLAAAIIGHNVTYRFGDGDTLFAGLEFTFNRGRHALVGTNGSGKSTLARILAGVTPPTEGSLTRLIPLDRTLYLPQALSNEPDWELADELGIGKEIRALRRIEAGSIDPLLFDVLESAWDVEERAQRALESVDLGHLRITRQFSDRLDSLSPGERMRVRIAHILLRAPELLVLDEPTNHLDNEARLALLDFLRSYTGALIVISHDRELLLDVDQIWELSDLGLRLYGGNFDLYRDTRVAEVNAATERLARAQTELERRRKLAEEATERQLHRMEHGRRYADTGLPKVHRGNLKRRSLQTLAKVRDQHGRLVQEAADKMREAEELKEQILPAQDLQITVDEVATAVPRQRILVEARDINFHLPEDGGRLWQDDVSFDLPATGRLAVLGGNGAGKTTLLNAIQGLKVPFEMTGSLRVRAKAIATVDQNLSRFDASETLLEIFREINPRLTDDERRLRLGKFLFSERQILKPCRTLSGGEKVRAALALALTSKSDLLILDEPNHDLDAEALSQLVTVLRDLPCALILVSHNKEFLNALGDVHSVILDRGGARRRPSLSPYAAPQQLTPQ